MRTAFVILALVSSANSAFLKPAIIKKTPVPRAATPVAITGLEGPALVTAAHTIMAYNFMPLGPTAKGLGMGGKSMSEGQYNWGARAWGNMQEQAPYFYATLWIHAAFVSPIVATQLGMAYLALRFCYPVIWALLGGEKGVPFTPYAFPFPLKVSIYWCTFPQYGIIFYMAFATVLKLAFGFCLNTLVKKPLLAAPIGFGLFLWHYAYVLYPILNEKLFCKCFGEK